jgi:Uma2 family endonuclease
MVPGSREATMVALQHARYVSREEYLRLEQDAEFKSEYDDGVVVAMSGSTPEHAKITFNLGGVLVPRLRNTGCAGYSPDLRAQIEIANRYYYPDVTVVCGQPDYDKVFRSVSVRNPALLVEVLSPSTQHRDRGTKWFACQTLESLDVYVLVHQDRPLVEWYTRAGEGDSWEYRSVAGLDAMAAVRLAGSACALPLSEIYEGIDFRAAEEAGPVSEGDDRSG